jgi:hypothetical protein
MWTPNTDDMDLIKRAWLEKKMIHAQDVWFHLIVYLIFIILVKFSSFWICEMCKIGTQKNFPAANINGASLGALPPQMDMGLLACPRGYVSGPNRTLSMSKMGEGALEFP